jgi:putative hydrolase of the HAD superfamily
VELAEKHRLREHGVTDLDQFIAGYLLINEELWDQYRNDLIDKETLRNQRFYRALLSHNINNRELSDRLSDDYITQSPHKTNLLEHTTEVLDYLKEKYTLHIITNGFEEVQHIKIKKSGLDKYFSEIITSERAGFKKPDPRIFHYSLTAAKADASESLMIGDCLQADVGGAKGAGMAQVYFNPSSLQHSEEITHEIRTLKELLDIL